MSQTEPALIPVPPVPASRARLSRRSRVLVLLGLAAVAVVVVVLVVTGAFSGGGPSSSGVADNSYPTALTHVLRESLSSQTEVSATLTYAGSATVVLPAGTAPSALLQAQQAVTTDESMLQSDAATLSSDTASASQLQADLTAARAKEAVDCAGANAAEGAPSSSASAASGSAGPCASDEQAVTTDQQTLTTDEAKLATDRMQVSSAQTGLSGAEASLNADGSSAAIFGQDSIYTALPAVGQRIRRGQTLFAVSGTPVLLLYGAVAPWRAFSTGMSPGADVAELNANLDALGYGNGLRGDRFTSATAQAIEALQRAHGMAATGQLLLGSVAFEPGAVRVTAVTPTLGATVAPGPVLTVTQTTRQVQIQLDAAQQSEIKVGDPVTITLPDNSTTPGRVTYVGTVATTPSSANDQGGSSTPTIEVNVTPTDPAATGSLDQAPVTVSITTASVSNALVVPVDALLALASGGYALEEVGAGGVHHLVAVNLGLFDDADGYVQVTGPGVAAGQRVVVPRI